MHVLHFMKQLQVKWFEGGGGSVKVDNRKVLGAD